MQLDFLKEGIHMDEKKRFYIAIDCKSFYASVECLERGLDPMTTNLVVADESRTDKTINRYLYHLPCCFALSESAWHTGAAASV